jgi:predicted CoA-binding protein
MSETVAVLGASTDRARFSNRAQHALAAHGHRVLPVNPTLDAVDGVPTVALEALPEGIDTITVYLRAERLRPLVEAVAARRPRRVILNPGADDPEMVAALEAEGLRVQCDCTLVLLDTGRY